MISNSDLFSAFRTDTTHDIWQFGIVVFICLTGKNINVSKHF